MTDLQVASAKSEDEVKRLCHFGNLQPLWRQENIKKAARVGYG